MTAPEGCSTLILEWHCAKPDTVKFRVLRDEWDLDVEPPVWRIYEVEVEEPLHR